MSAEGAAAVAGRRKWLGARMPHTASVVARLGPARARQLTLRQGLTGPPKPMRVRFGGVPPGLPPPSRPCASPRSASSGRRAARGGLVRCPVRAAKNTNHPRHEVNRADRAETATVLAEETEVKGERVNKQAGKH